MCLTSCLGTSGAARVDGALSEEVKNLQHGLSRITQLIESSGDDDDGVACADACSAFRDLATGALRGLEADVDAASDAFRETLSYLREAEQTPEEFFSTSRLSRGNLRSRGSGAPIRARAEQRRRDEERRRPSAERRIEAKLSRESAPVLHSPKQRTHRRTSTGALPQNAALEAMLERRQPRSRSSPADSPPPPPPPSALAGRVRDRGVARGRVAAAGSVVARAAGHAALPPPPPSHAARDARSDDSDYSCDEDDLAAVADLDLGH